MGHLPETKIQKFLHEPVNVGRTIEQSDYTTIPSTAEAIPTPLPRERTNPYG